MIEQASQEQQRNGRPRGFNPRGPLVDGDDQSEIGQFGACRRLTEARRLHDPLQPTVFLTTDARDFAGA